MFLREDLLPPEKQHLIRALNQNYDYCYMDAMLNINIKSPADIIITGSSHGLDAFNASQFCISTKNLCMHTQDIYYDIQVINHIISHTQKMFSTWIITLGYYSLFYDLSKTTYSGRCYQVYKPIFSDIHNAPFIENDNSAKFFSIDEINFYRDYFLRYQDYYGPAVKREFSNAEILKKGGWNNLDTLHREEYAQKRVLKHNKHLNYTETYNENTKLLKKTIEKLCDFSCRVVVVIPPFSNEYNQGINPYYKENMISFFDSVDYPIEFVDMNDSSLFLTEDFIDSDHLSDIGANKATYLLNQLLFT